MKHLFFFFTSFILVSFCAGNISSASFSDVPSENIYADAVTYIEEHDIANGYPDGTFRPDELINRAEFTKIIMKPYQEIILNSDPHAEGFILCDVSSDKLGELLEFSDVSAEDWYAPYICAAKYYGVVSGYPDLTFRPAETINFAEAAKIIAEVFGFDEAEFSDSEIWYKVYVKELGLRNAIPLTIERFDQKISRGEMAEMISRVHGKIDTKGSKTYEQIAGVNVFTDERSGLSFEYNSSRYHQVSLKDGEAGFSRDDCVESDFFCRELFFDVYIEDNDNQYSLEEWYEPDGYQDFEYVTIAGRNAILDHNRFHQYFIPSARLFTNGLPRYFITIFFAENFPVEDEEFIINSITLVSEIPESRYSEEDPVFSGNGEGCGSIFLFAKNSAETVFLSIDINILDLEITSGENLFDLSQKNDGLVVEVKEYESEGGSQYYCNDTREEDVGILEEWQAVGGNFALTLPDNFDIDAIKDSWDSEEETDPYYINAVLSDAVFRNTRTGDEFSIDAFTFRDIFVGWSVP